MNLLRAHLLAPFTCNVPVIAQPHPPQPQPIVAFTQLQQHVLGRYSATLPTCLPLSLRAIRLGFTANVSVIMLQETIPQETGVQGQPSELPTASPTSPTQGLVMPGPAPGRSMGPSSSRASSGGRQAGAQTAVEAAPGRPTLDVAQPSSARDQVRP